MNWAKIPANAGFRAFFDAVYLSSIQDENSGADFVIVGKN